VWVNDQSHQHELFELLRDTEPHCLLEVEELLVPLVLDAPRNEQVKHDADRPHITLGARLVVVQLGGDVNSVYAGDVRETTLVAGLGDEHCTDVGELHCDRGLSFESVFDKN